MKRIQYKRSKGWRMPENAVYVGRPSKWGNPYKIGIDGTRLEVIEKYLIWLDAQLQENRKFLEPLKGKDLACWCPLNMPCHADIIIKILNEKGKEASKV